MAFYVCIALFALTVLLFVVASLWSFVILNAF